MEKTRKTKWCGHGLGASTATLRKTHLKSYPQKNHEKSVLKKSKKENSKNGSLIYKINKV